MKPTEQHIILPGNRKLGFAEYGNPAGFPILYCHGSQSSRLEMHYNLSFAKEKELRILTVDRPGHGISDFNPAGTILSFAQDLKVLTEKLELASYSVVGMSAGSPFALGFSYLFPEKIHKTGIISGFAPLTTESKKVLSKEVKTMLSLAKSMPFLLKIFLKVQAKQLAIKPKKALNNFLQIMSEPDQLVLKNEKVMEVIESMFKEAFRNGSQGVAYEISTILVQKWGFELKEIKGRVQFWQGKEDNNVPYQWAELMTNECRHSELKLYEDEGHLIIFEHAAEIFGELKP